MNNKFSSDSEIENNDNSDISCNNTKNKQNYILIITSKNGIIKYIIILFFINTVHFLFISVFKFTILDTFLNRYTNYILQMYHHVPQ